MIAQEIHIPKYDWKVWVYYGLNKHFTDEIILRLVGIGCVGYALKSAIKNIKRHKLNTGVTYSNFRQRKSVVVISPTTSAAEFANTYDHEKDHLAKHIVEAIGIEPNSEEASYLRGEIGREMFKVAKTFMCECCRKKRNV